MIDLETLGRSPRGSILSIGAVVFSLEGGVGSEFIVNLKDDGRAMKLVKPSRSSWKGRRTSRGSGLTV
jgi:hypothetical protein